MKKTGRKLTLKGRLEADPIDTIISGGFQLTPIFKDDREGYGWKITGLNSWVIPTRDVEPYALFTTVPQDYATATAFSLSILNTEENNNAMVGCLITSIPSGPAPQVPVIEKVVDTDHVIVNQLSLLYSSEDRPGYIIYLEEYEISDREEIAFKIKEIGQSIDPVE
tara:strand:- start:98 stop:595 length:498 start_codon:yes stop_codon:yes gene_type:complete